MGAAASTKSRRLRHVYNVEGELGSGAFSVVKLGIHRETGTRAAVKVVDKKKLTEEDYEGLLSEIQILQALDHPHIIKFYETFDENSEFFIVTELAEGGELFDRIVSKDHYTEKEARDLFRIMLEAMSYIHHKGIVHRDLKPENLLLCSLTDDTNIKIADFGFAKRVADLSPKDSACGTPRYISPEMLRGDRYGCEVDIWSMGVICYVLVSGYSPFYDDDQKLLFKKIREGRYHFHEDYWAKTSLEAVDIIKKMLCVDQKQRWTADQLLDHPWMSMSDDSLVGKDLSNSISTMRKFKSFKSS